VKGKKDDDGKLDFTLVNFKVFEGMVRVLMAGAKHYGRDNWKLVPDGKQRYIKAAIRHFIDWMNDPDGCDNDSGLPHIDHLFCNLYFLKSNELSD